MSGLKWRDGAFRNRFPPFVGMTAGILHRVRALCTGRTVCRGRHGCRERRSNSGDRSPIRKNEEELRDSERLLRQIIDNAPIALGTTDLQGNILSANPYCCELFGYTEEEFTARAVQQSTHPDDRDTVLELQKRLAAGEPRMLIGSLEDITEKKAAEEESRRLRHYLKNIQAPEAPPDAAELAETEASDQEVAEVVLSAHRTLANLSEENWHQFKGVVSALEAELHRA